MKIDCLKFVEELRKQHEGELARLAIIQVGDDEASNLYIKSKMKEALKWGVECNLIKLNFFVSTKEVIDAIEYTSAFNDGVIVQLPLPEHIDAQLVLDAIPLKKNVDGFKQTNVSKQLYQPCTPMGIIMLLESLTELEGKTVTLIGRGKTVGEPLRNMLLNKNCTLIVCHSYTPEDKMKTMLTNSDIIISAVGKPKLFNVYNLCKKGIVIDVGISRVDYKQVGDFDHKDVEIYDICYTPWTNGIGKVTVAALMINTLTAAKMDKELNYCEK